MAIKSNSGFMVEEPTLADKAADVGSGVVNTPAGGNTVGGNEDQNKMAGTPVQQQAQQRRQNQTLSQQQRYEPPKPAQPTTADQAAKNKAETLANLGPVRSRVQGLIEQRVQAAASQNIESTADIQINTQAIADLKSQGIDTAAAEAALRAYLDASPEEKEAKLTEFYQTLGDAKDELLEGGGINNYLLTGDQIMGNIAQDALSGAVTLGQLNLDQINVDLAQLEQDLGLEPGAAANMTLDQLDAAIDAVEAQELNRVDQIRAQLNDPNLPPAMRQQLLAQLGDLAAAGITGAEASVEELDAQIAAGNTVTIGGRDWSLEEALGDKGISATIANAVSNPDELEALKDIPGYEDLAKWITDNKPILETLISEVETEAGDFVNTQQEYRSVRDSLGPGNEGMLAEIVGIDLTDGPVTTAQMEALDAAMKDPANVVVLDYFKDPDNSDVVNELKDDPTRRAAVIGLLRDGVDDDDIDELITNYTALVGDATLDKLLGDMEFPTDAASLKDFQDRLAVWNSLDDAQEVAKELASQGLISYEDMAEIALMDDPLGTFQTIQNAAQKDKTFQKEFEAAENPRQFILDKLFKGNIPSLRDLNSFLSDNTDSPAAQAILKIFDKNNDGKIYSGEWSRPDINAYKELEGIGTTKEDIMAGGELADMPDTLVIDAAIGGQFAKKAKEKIAPEYKRLSAKAADEIQKSTNRLHQAITALGITVDPSMTAQDMKAEVDRMMDLYKQHDSQTTRYKNQMKKVEDTRAERDRVYNTKPIDLKRLRELNLQLEKETQQASATEKEIKRLFGDAGVGNLKIDRKKMRKMQEALDSVDSWQKTADRVNNGLKNLETMSDKELAAILDTL